eukprot:m.362900 g.362900  ORF g.362900 m.362900 type:complete len:202 (+) comp56021_c0_seq6:1410-2015(+)
MAGKSMAVERVKRELVEVKKDKHIKELQIDVDVVSEGNFAHLHSHIAGPVDTPYHGGEFHLDVVVPAEYPFKPPIVKFVTRIWHPNISSQTGTICLDILKDQWAAGMTLRTVLISVQALLASPQPDDPQDAVVAEQCMKRPAVFRRTAVHWTTAYAHGKVGTPDEDAKISQVGDLGFSPDQARAALSAKDWNVEAAINHLL